MRFNRIIEPFFNRHMAEITNDERIRDGLMVSRCHSVPVTGSSFRRSLW
ncbi:hypothetical protein [Spirosoma jeollabukense]